MYRQSKFNDRLDSIEQKAGEILEATIGNKPASFFGGYIVAVALITAIYTPSVEKAFLLGLLFGFLIPLLSCLGLVLLWILIRTIANEWDPHRGTWYKDDDYGPGLPL